MEQTTDKYGFRGVAKMHDEILKQPRQWNYTIYGDVESLKQWNKFWTDLYNKHQYGNNKR